jgi:hypothetical protein
MKFLTRSLRVAVLLCLAPTLGLHAQTPGPQLTNTVTICPTEGCTVTAISSATAVLQFGVGSTWNTITSPTLPLLASCLSACPQVGGDPAPGVVKSLVAQQQAAAYTVTLSDGTVIPVPALPQPAPTSLATSPGQTYAVTLTPVAAPPPPDPPKLGLTDLPGSGANVAYESTQFNLTIGGVTLTCTYASRSGNVYTLNCVVPGN